MAGIRVMSMHIELTEVVMLEMGVLFILVIIRVLLTLEMCQGCHLD